MSLYKNINFLISFSKGTLIGFPKESANFVTEEIAKDNVLKYAVKGIKLDSKINEKDIPIEEFLEQSLQKFNEEKFRLKDNDSRTKKAYFLNWKKVVAIFIFLVLCNTISQFNFQSTIKLKSNDAPRENSLVKIEALSDESECNAINILKENKETTSIEILPIIIEPFIVYQEFEILETENGITYNLESNEDLQLQYPGFMVQKMDELVQEIGKYWSEIHQSYLLGFIILRKNMEKDWSKVKEYQDAATKKYVDDQIALSVSASIENASLGTTDTLDIKTTGVQNIAAGTSSLSMNTTCDGNAVFRANSLLKNTTSDRNVVVGIEAFQNNTTGNNNVAIENRTLLNNVDGSQNTEVGNLGLKENSDRDYNTRIGYRAMFNNNNIVFGALKDNMTGMNNTVIEGGADVSKGGLSNATSIGSDAEVTASSSIRLGNSSVNNIEGQVNFTAGSDRKFKTNIEKSTLGLEFIQQLNPVTYNMKEHGNIQYTGFIAQEVDELVRKMGRDWSGVKRPANTTEHFRLRYAGFTVPLVIEQKTYIEILQSEYTAQKESNEKLRAKNKELESRLDRIEKLLIDTPMTMHKIDTLQESARQAKLSPQIIKPFISGKELRMFIPQNVENVQLIITNGSIFCRKTIEERGAINIDLAIKNLPQGNNIYVLIMDGKRMIFKPSVLNINR